MGNWWEVVESGDLDVVIVERDRCREYLLSAAGSACDVRRGGRGAVEKDVLTDYAT